jgi:hypothetical protein
MQEDSRNSIFTTDLELIEDLEGCWDFSGKDRSGREVGKVWIRQAAHQILYGSRQVELVVRTGINDRVHGDNEAMSTYMVRGLRGALRGYVPSMSGQLLGFLEDRTTPSDVPQPPHLGSAMAMWDEVQGLFTPEEWAHDWLSDQ